ncbi:MAG: hypothetical protein GXP19_06325 [Gammaproteobacteria bacterium]|nr:hypothetical protein [Gammaproteobacteria bacterium]
MKTVKFKALHLLLMGLLFFSFNLVNANEVGSHANRQVDCQINLGLKASTEPVAACTKYCTDCQTCDTYCCEGTTPEDLGVLYIDE